MAVVAFAAPAGLDALGVGMVEAGHVGDHGGALGADLVGVLSVGVVGEERQQALSGVPVAVGFAVGHPELPGRCRGRVGRGAADGHLAFVDGCVVELAEQDQVVQVGGSAVGPVDQMMGFQVVALVAAGELAPSVVADHQGSAEGAGDQASGAAEGEDAAVGVEDGAEQVAVAGELAGGLGFDPADALEMAGRVDGGWVGGLFGVVGRSRGNVVVGAGELVGVDLDDDEGPVFAGAVFGGGVHEDAGDVEDRVGGRVRRGRVGRLRRGRPDGAGVGLRG